MRSTSRGPTSEMGIKTSTSRTRRTAARRSGLTTGSTTTPAPRPSGWWTWRSTAAVRSTPPGKTDGMAIQTFSTRTPRTGGPRGPRMSECRRRTHPDHTIDPETTSRSRSASTIRSTSSGRTAEARTSTSSLLGTRASRRRRLRSRRVRLDCPSRWTATRCPIRPDSGSWSTALSTQRRPRSGGTMGLLTRSRPLRRKASRPMSGTCGPLGAMAAGPRTSSPRTRLSRSWRRSSRRTRCEFPHHRSALRLSWTARRTRAQPRFGSRRGRTTRSRCPLSNPEPRECDTGSLRGATAARRVTSSRSRRQRRSRQISQRSTIWMSSLQFRARAEADGTRPALPRRLVSPTRRSQWPPGSAPTSNPIVMDGAKVATAMWKTQYELQVVSAYGDVSGQGWYDAGSTAVARLAPSVVPLTAGTRATFVSWTGDATGTDPIASSSIPMNGPRTVGASWRIEHELTIDTQGHGTAIGTGWYVSGSFAVAGLNASIVGVSPGTRVEFAGWTGDATGTAASDSSPILMAGPRTATAEWRTEYYLRVDSDIGAIQGTGWYLSQASVTIRAPAQMTSEGQIYQFSGWTGDRTSSDSSITITMNGPTTVRATWSSTAPLGGLSAPGWGLIGLVVAAALAAIIFLRRRRVRRP